MAEVVLYHHSQGLTDGVKAFADELRQAGHTVHTPDLYEGNTYATLDEGMDYARATGFGVIAERGVQAAQGLPSSVVYAGFSLGVVPAQQLAQTRAGAVGALFYYSCLPVEEFGAWPDDVPVQVHGMDEDPFFTEEGGDLDAAKALVAAVDGAELFLYPGKEHLFADSSLPGYDEPAAKLLLERTLAFLG
ncbi:dienelactone hydrolase [Kribbella sp. VKM Ac-2569]|uniref:dienelactone hydrolase family protein n=1 Tax=Kribbella sp. VKM Ac-2569 TaxID=2512220 RepID=UPI00102CD96E|nr:dienelactone hydrolase family protein [Kribbella sp. VKM Ac-2569]RZT28182.1 dienelactone hydrolase [Kribbella sp. VKM Ac-2569]